MPVSSTISSIPASSDSPAAGSLRRLLSSRPLVASAVASAVAAGGVMLAVVAGCGAGFTYTAGAFSGRQGPFPGSQLLVGCLDVAVAAVSDPRAEGAVAEINFGNRCDARVGVDLTAITATGRYDDGHTIPLHVYDPDRSIHPGMLDVGDAGREVLEFQRGPRALQAMLADHTVDAEADDVDAADAEPALAALCLDLSRLDPDEPSAKPMWACVDVPRPLDLGSDLGSDL